METTSILRTKVKIKSEKNSVILHFISKDTSALRASINSYLRFVSISKEIIEVIEYFYKKENG